MCKYIMLLALLTATVSAAEMIPPEDTPVEVRLFVGPTFWTGDPDMPTAEAIAVDHDGRIIESYAVRPKGLPWPVTELPGELAIPGLHDAHLHVMGIGRLKEQVRLEGCTSAADAREKVWIWAAENPNTQIIRGRGWDQSRWPGQEFPSWADLEGVDERPIYLRRVDGHAAWLNRAMLELAGITADTPDPKGGRILRDIGGAPTGLLVDNAIDLLDGVLPDPTNRERERWLLSGLNACADAGLVAVHDMGQSPATCDVAEKLATEGRLPIRLFIYLEGSRDDSMGAMAMYKPQARFEVMGMKYYADGALGSRGAALLADYSDEPGHSGLMIVEPAELERKVNMVHRRGYQCAIHAIGDRGNRMALTAIRKAQAGELGRRHRVEHAQVVHPDDFARFVTEGAIASMQPTHCTSDMRWAEQRLGSERVLGAYAWRTFSDLGVPMSFGSDAPIEHWDPLAGIYAAITRQQQDGEPAGGWYPEQRLNWKEAVAGFTSGAAYAVHHEDDLGRLMMGRMFDVTILDRDPRSDPRDWLEAKVTALIVGGERVR